MGYLIGGCMRVFLSPWHELDELCKLIHTWMHTYRNRYYARNQFGPKLEKLLGKVPCTDQSMLRQEAASLFYEMNENYRMAEVCREREVNLLVKVYNKSKTLANREHSFKICEKLAASRMILNNLRVDLDFSDVGG